MHSLSDLLYFAGMSINMNLENWQTSSSLHDDLHLDAESDRALPFLDVMVTRANSGNLDTSVFTKPTHTAQYFHFLSSHPKEHKHSVVHALLHRAKIHSSSTTARIEEETKVMQVLKRNGYPLGFIKHCVMKCLEWNCLQQSNSQLTGYSSHMLKPCQKQSGEFCKIFCTL